MTGGGDRTSDAPLRAWGEALRAGKARRSRLIRRITVTTAGIGVVLLPVAFPPAPRFVWNASASAPMGLYAVTAPGPSRARWS